jgi:hypothetical protein
LIDGHPTYVSLKATSIPGDASHIIIGVNNVDSQVKDRIAAAKAREEEKTYLRLSALNGNLLVLYIVDPENGSYKEFSSSKSFDQFKINKEGSDFFTETHDNGQGIVYSEDMELFNSVITKDNILSAIERDGVFIVDYRLIMNGGVSYIRFKAAGFEEDGRKQLIVGLLDIDAQVRQEKQYAHEGRDGMNL